LEDHYHQLASLQDSLASRAKIRREVESLSAWRGPIRNKLHDSSSDSEVFTEVELCDGCFYRMDFYHRER